MHLLRDLNRIPLGQKLEKVPVVSVCSVELATIEVDASKRDGGLDVALVVVGVINEVEGVRHIVTE